MRKLARRLSKRFSWRARELRRLSSLARGVASSTCLIEPIFRTIDGPSFAAQFDQIFLQQAFDFQPATSRPFILDCGANMGVFTVYARLRHPSARVVAFEPDPKIFEVLHRNVETCCGMDGITLVPAAVTHQPPGLKKFFADHLDSGRLDHDFPGAEFTLVEAVCLRDYLSDGCDLLKVDVEGAEVDLIAGCADLLPLVGNIFVEYHSLVGRRQRLDELITVLSGAGFRLQVRSGKSTPSPFLRTSERQGMDMQLDIWGTREATGL